MAPLQEWFAAWAAGPLLSGVDGCVGASRVFDAALLAAGFAMLFSFARALTGSARVALLAAALALVHPAVWTALPNDARGTLLASALGLAALRCGLGGAAGSARLTACAFLLLASALACGSPAAGAFSLVLATLSLERGARRAAAGGFLVFVADVAARMAAGPGAAPAAAVRAGALSVAPLEPGFDLIAQGFGTADAVALGLAIAAVAAAARDRASRSAVFLWLSGILALGAAGAPRAFLHDRAGAALAPAAALCIASVFELRFLGSLRERAAGRALALAQAGLVILLAAVASQRYTTARDTERYLEAATAAAPRSAVLWEAYGQVLGAKARSGEADTRDRTARLLKAASILADGARWADPDRRFRMLVSSVDFSILAGALPDAQRLMPAVAEAAIDPEKDAAAAMLRARYLDAAGDPEGAARCLEVSLAKHPDSASLRREWWRAVSAFHAARAMGSGTAAEASRAVLARIEAEIPSDLDVTRPREVRAAAHVARGRIALARGKPIDALRDFVDAKRIDPTFSDAYLGAAESYLSQGHGSASSALLEGAERELREGLLATEAAPSVEILILLAAVQLQRGADPLQAIEWLSAARRVAPGERKLSATFAAAYVLLSDRRLRKGDVKSAEEAALAAVAEAPSLPAAQAALGAVRAQQKRVEEAVEWLEKAYVGEPNEEHREALAEQLKISGMNALMRRQTDRAVGRFLRLRSLGAKTVELGSGADLLRESARSEYEKGIAAFEAKDRESGRAHLQKSLEYLPENFYALYALGTLEADAGGDDHAGDPKALELWLRALEAAKADGVDLSESGLLYNLASLHARARRYADARGAAQRYLAFGKGPFTTKCKALVEAIDAAGK